MGLSGVEFTPLSRLTIGYHRCSRVRVRVSRMWVASNPLDGMVFGLDCLLIDGEGGTMQARASTCNMKRLQQQLVEGKVYALSDFTVSPRLKKYMACRNGLMIKMGGQTVVEEIGEDPGSPIPMHSFEFVDFKDVPRRNGDRSFFIDIIGQIKSIEDIGHTWKWESWSNIPFRNICLTDLRGGKLNVALFGNLGRDFDADHVFDQGQKAPVVVVFAGMSVRRYNGKGFTAYSTSASKYYMNLELLEMQEFRASLRNPPEPVGRFPCQQQNPLNPSELVDSWRTIEQLKTLNPHELEKTKFLCMATLIGVDCTQGWCYLSCFHCNRSISGDRSESQCTNQGCPNNLSPIWRYKLNAVMEDSTGAMNIMIFDDQARDLVGFSVEELFEDTIGDDDVMRVARVSALVASCGRRAFLVDIEKGSFIVKHILNDDALALLQCKRSGQMDAADGGLLSQEEGSSSSCGCTSRVKKEKTTIKEERESKRLKTDEEDEQTIKRVNQRD